MNTRGEELKNVCQAVYDMHGLSGNFGKRYFDKHIEVFSRFDTTEVLLYNMKNFNYDYAVELVLSLPALWTSKLTSDWIRLFENNSPRPVLKWYDDRGDYADISILMKFFEIDPLTHYLNNNNIQRQDKLNVISYFQRFWFTIRYDPIDNEDFDGEYFAEESLILETRKKIINEGVFSSIRLETPEDINDYFSNLKRSLPELFP